MIESESWRAKPPGLYFMTGMDQEGEAMHSLSVAPSSSVDNTVYRNANAAHQVVDTLADQALTGVGKVSDSLHTAVNHAADVVSHTTDWVAEVPAQIRRKRIKL